MLIQSNLESLPVHTMQCFELPKQNTKMLDKVHRNFFWKKSNVDKGLPMISWEKICRPKKFGGLGFRKTTAINLAFQCKLAWKILQEKENLWVAIMTAKYLKHSNFLIVTPKPSDSPVWKSVLRSRSLLKKGLRWIVGTGENISFWWDNWVDNFNLIELLGRDSSLLSNPDCTVGNFITRDKNWDLPKLRIVLDNDLIIQKLLGIPIRIFEKQDTFCWGLTGSGSFNTRSATWTAHNSVDPRDAAWSFKWIWHLDIMPKIKICL